MESALYHDVRVLKSFPCSLFHALRNQKKFAGAHFLQLDAYHLSSTSLVSKLRYLPFGQTGFMWEIRNRAHCLYKRVLLNYLQLPFKFKTGRNNRPLIYTTNSYSISYTNTYTHNLTGAGKPKSCTRFQSSVLAIFFLQPGVGVALL